LTCIVGLVDKEGVFIGGDSAGVGGTSLTVRADQKVFLNGDFIMGFTTSFRMGQLLRYGLKPPTYHPDVDVFQYMVTDFIDSIRTCLKNGGWASREKDVEVGGTFLVGFKGRLFKIDSDYQVGEPAQPFDCCGCGEDIALGAMYASADLLPEIRIKQALEAAETFSAGVRGPFTVKHISL